MPEATVLIGAVVRHKFLPTKWLGRPVGFVGFSEILPPIPLTLSQELRFPGLKHTQKEAK